MFVDPLPEPVNPKRAPNWHACPNVIKAHHDALERVIDLTAQEDYPIDDEEGEFAVIITGGGKYWLGSALCCHMLRHFGYDGPIEVWHGHHFDSEPVDPKAVEGLDVRIVNAHEVMKYSKPRIVDGYGSKLHAIRNCRYRRILFLDADAYPVAPIGSLIEYARNYPLCYWIDFPNMALNLKWSKLVDEFHHVPQVQGGHLFIDRHKAWQVILIADWLCQHSDFYFRYFFGDQDAIRLALGITQVEYHTIDNVKWIPPAIVCKFQGNPIIVHRVAAKPFLMKNIRNRRDVFGCYPQLPEEGVVYTKFQALHKMLDNADIVENYRKVYEANLWDHSKCEDFFPRGRTLEYINLVTLVAHAIHAKTIIDLGCGPGWITEEIARRCPKAQVTGFDLLPLWSGRNNYACEFRQADIREVEKLPQADVVLCKDVLHHWPNIDITRFLSAYLARKDWKALIVTNDYNQFADDTWHGGYRALNPDREPLKTFAPWHKFHYAHKAVLVKFCDSPLD